MLVGTGGYAGDRVVYFRDLTDNATDGILRAVYHLDPGIHLGLRRVDQ